MVVRMSLMTLSSSAIDLAQPFGRRILRRRQHGVQPHAGPEHPLNDEVVQIAGDAIALLGRVQGAQVEPRPVAP